MKIVAGLGNPGIRYRDTRHNTGFRVVDRLAVEAGQSFGRGRFEAEEALLRWRGERILLLKPQTYMNLSGRSVSRTLRYYKLGPHDLCVVVDDLDLPVGRIRMRARGSAGGHNGLSSVFQELGVETVARLRIGIGREAKGGAADYVLSPFEAPEEEAVDRAVTRACEAVHVWAKLGIEACMNRFNAATGHENDESHKGKDDDGNDRVDRRASDV